MRAERILSRGGSEFFFNLEEDMNHFFPNTTIVFPILGEDRSSDPPRFRPHCSLGLMNANVLTDTKNTISVLMEEVK